MKKKNRLFCRLVPGITKFVRWLGKWGGGVKDYAKDDRRGGVLR